MAPENSLRRDSPTDACRRGSSLQIYLLPHAAKLAQRLIDELRVFRAVEPATDAGWVRQRENAPAFAFEDLSNQRRERFLAEESRRRQSAECDDQLRLNKLELAL